jgi:hypothetical protein
MSDTSPKDAVKAVAKVVPSKDGTGIIGVEWIGFEPRKLMFDDLLYSAEALSQVRKQALLEAAELCNALFDNNPESIIGKAYGANCYAAIMALAAKE